MRLAAFCDLRYQRRDGAMFCEESFARFLAGLREHADELVLAGRLDTRSGSAFAHRLPDDVGLLGLPDYPALTRPGPAISAVARSLAPLWRLLGRVDAIWVLGPHPLGLFCVAMAAVRRRRVVLGVREDLRAYVRRRHAGGAERAVAWALELAWRALARRVPVVVVGDELARRYRHAGVVLPVAVSLVDGGEVVDAASALGRDYEGELVALSVGRLDPEKNPLLLAEIVKRLREHDPRWRLVVCGVGSLEPELARRLDELGLSASGDLQGTLGADALRTRYESSHALLHVSWTEGIPQVLFEAWAAGLPVVATDVGGVAAVARQAAVLVPPGDAGAAVDALRRVAADADLRRGLIEAGFERVRRHSRSAELGRVATLLNAHTDGGLRHPHRHMWLWAVLPPDARRVAVVDDAELSELMAASGFDLVQPAARPDAVLVGDGGAGARTEARSAAPGLPQGGVLAIPLGGGREELPMRQSRAVRALQLLGSPALGLGARVRGASLARALRRQGFAVTTLPTGERARPYGLGAGGWRRRRRIPVGVVVAASRTELPSSTTEVAIQEAAIQLGVPLRPRGTTVVESGKLMTQLVDPAGRRYFLRLAGGPARPPLERALRSLTALAAAEPPQAVRDHVPWPLVHGEVGPALYVLEPMGAGGHPRRMTARLWRECLDFLVGLHTLRAMPPTEHEDGLTAIADQARSIEVYASAERRAVLRRIAERLREELDHAPLGWTHGDLWNENLLTRHGRLELVVDWDWAAPRSLPALDLFDLTALSPRRRRDLRHGPRFLRVLWPLARRGGDKRIRRYCSATGTPSDPRTLEGLAVAYWLNRLARDTRPFEGFPQQPGWREENIEAPLSTLQDAGW